MSSPDHSAEHPTQINPYTAADVLAILHENRWLITDPTLEQTAWADRAAQLLGHYAKTREGLGNLLRLVFAYYAAQILQTTDAHTALATAEKNPNARMLTPLVLEIIAEKS